MSGPGAAASLVTTDLIAGWHNLPRAVEVDGVTYYGGIRSTGQIAVVELT